MYLHTVKGSILTSQERHHKFNVVAFLFDLAGKYKQLGKIRVGIPSGRWDLLITLKWSLCIFQIFAVYECLKFWMKNGYLSIKSVTFIGQNYVQFFIYPYGYYVPIKIVSRLLSFLKQENKLFNARHMFQWRSHSQQFRILLLNNLFCCLDFTYFGIFYTKSKDVFDWPNK